MKITINDRYGNPIVVEDVPDVSAYPLRTALEQLVARGVDLSGVDLSGVDLSGANLEYADLRGANLRGAILRGAILTSARLHGVDFADANLTGADLTGADLSGARRDLLAVLDAAPGEVAGLLQAIRDGKINGSFYVGECCCLKGTIANLQGKPYRDLWGDPRPGSMSPSEWLFMAISPGHTPANHPIAKIIEGWIVECQSRHQPTMKGIPQ